MSPRFPKVVPIGTPEKEAAMLAMKEAELAARNTAGGYWIAAADPGAADHAVTGSWRVSQTTQLAVLAVLADGAARLVDLFQATTWRGVLGMLDQAGPRWVLDEVRRFEQLDPTGVRWPRNKANDDVTCVYALPDTPDRQQARIRRMRQRETLADYEQRMAVAAPVLSMLNSDNIMGAVPTKTGEFL